MSITNNAVWFIADAGGGVAAALAEAVLAAGQSVALAARDPARVQGLAARHPGQTLALALDITDAASIDAAVAAAEAHFGRIDVLASSASRSCLAAVEEGDEDTMRALFEDNVFGPVNLARRVLPGMRARRAGHVVMLARASLPSPAGEGFGHAARSALEALAEALFYEVEPLGIGVTLVDTVGGEAAQPHGAAIADYAGLAARRGRPAAPGTAGEVDAARAAAAIMQAVAAGRGPLRLVLGRAALQRAYDRLRILKVGFDAWAELTASADAPGSAKAAPARRTAGRVREQADA